MDASADSLDRRAIYQRLVWRNRVVGLMRLGVPAAALLAFAGLGVQLYLASFGRDIAIGSITLDRNSVVVDAPRYAGVLPDGSTFRVQSESARAAIGNLDRITATNAVVDISKPGGVKMRATADTADIDNKTGVIVVHGRSNVTDSTGSKGFMTDPTIDSNAQTIAAPGPVNFVLGDGTIVLGDGMEHDEKAGTWHFTNATLVLPATPGQFL